MLNATESKLATYLLQDNLINHNDAAIAMTKAAEKNISLAQYLVSNKILSAEAIFNACKKNSEHAVFDLNHYNPAWLTMHFLHPDLAQRYRVLPIKKDDNNLFIGIADPTHHATLSALEFHTGLRITPLLVNAEQLANILDKHLNTTFLEAKLEATLAKIHPVEEKIVPYDISDQDEGPVSHYVNHLLQNAIDKNISDIHIEPHSDNCRVRFRRDGLLYEAASIPSHLATRIITRLKIMANLNIAERRLPQDGHLSHQHQAQQDIRINTCPTVHGEKIVLRLLNVENNQLDLNTLGFTAAQLSLFLNTLQQPQGLILVTGPTGSGKTITLYSALHHLNQIEKNISSVEDPVEIELAGINQININLRIGLDFTHTLRALLRQDPDIIMLGEIRDVETATIAMQAAQTGHLVLSTLHTKSALESIQRLQAMNIASYQLIDAISLIIAQRLIRKLCVLCKQIDDNATNNYPIYKAQGCEHCHQGYQGRIGIFELLPMTATLATLLAKKAGTQQLNAEMKRQNHLTLWEAGLEKLQQGQTSYSELIRVLNKND